MHSKLSALRGVCQLYYTAPDQHNPITVKNTSMLEYTAADSEGLARFRASYDLSSPKGPANLGKALTALVHEEIPFVYMPTEAAMNHQKVIQSLNAAPYPIKVIQGRALAAPRFMTLA